MKLHTTILGEGEPMLILHGFLGMSDNWKTLGRQFADEGFQVHLIDQRNHGRSPHSATFNYDVLAEDVAEYCQSRELGQAVIIGHSMGGKSAMMAACQYPERFDKLVVVDIAPKYYAPHHQEILKGLTAIDQANLTSRGEAEDLLAKYISEASVRLFLLKNLYWKTKDKLALRLNLPVLKNSGDAIGAALAPECRFTKPTLFIRGQRSEYIQPEDEKNISEQFPSVRIETISGAGHWVHAEKRKEFFKAVMQFL